jgi:hypothetical protein
MEAGARPVIKRHGVSPEGVNVSNVTDRADASAIASSRRLSARDSVAAVAGPDLTIRRWPDH